LLPTMIRTSKPHSVSKRNIQFDVAIRLGWRVRRLHSVPNQTVFTHDRAISLWLTSTPRADNSAVIVDRHNAPMRRALCISDRTHFFVQCLESAESIKPVPHPHQCTSSTPKPPCAAYVPDVVADAGSPDPCDGGRALILGKAL